MGMISSEITVK